MWKKYIWNPATCSCENGKYVLLTIIDDSVIRYDEIMEETKTVPTKSTSTKAVLRKCTSINFYIVLVFLLITITLLKAVNIYWYLIKYQTKQKPLLPCHYTISKLKEINIKNWCVIISITIKVKKDFDLDNI